MAQNQKKYYYQQFKDTYKTFPGITASKLSEKSAYCRECKLDFSVSHGGLTDVKRHVASKKHQENITASSNTKTISNYFINNENTSVINAEVLFSEFLIEHSLPLAVADHASKLFKRMFPDSEIAKKYGSGRTKTSFLIDCLADDSKKKVIETLKNSYFSLSTDGSTDYDDYKLYPVCVRYFDNDVGRVLSVILSIQECSEASTGENIFKILEREIETLKIPWKNLVSFATDNASVMTGKHKGVAAFLQTKSPAVYINGMYND